MVCSNLPVNPNPSKAEVGKDFLLYINKGTVDTPVWILVGGQRSSDLSRSGDTIDTSYKGSGSWGGGMVGTLSWGLDTDALTVLNDEGANMMECAFKNRKQINTKLERPNGTYYTGWGSITDFSLSTPHTDVASISCSITGDGELVGPTPSLAPMAFTVKLTAVAAIVISLDPETVGITDVTRNGEALAAGDYTYASGVLTISATYLGGLTAGVHTFAAVTDVPKSSRPGFAEPGFIVTITA